MKKFALLPFAALAFTAACDDTKSPIAPEGPLFHHEEENKDDQHNGPTYVRGTFDVSITSQGIAPGVNQQPDGKGECRDASGNKNTTTTLNTVWYNEQGKKTNAKFCEGTAAGGTPVTTTVQCTISGLGIPATYAAAANEPTTVGNENLNFYTSEEADEYGDYHVHHKSNAGKTIGRGEITFDYTCGSSTTVRQATLALGQFGNPEDLTLNNGNLFTTGPVGMTNARALDVTGKEIVVVNTLGQGKLTSLYWVYRSRVGA